MIFWFAARLNQKQLVKKHTLFIVEKTLGIFYQKIINKIINNKDDFHCYSAL